MITIKRNKEIVYSCGIIGTTINTYTLNNKLYTANFDAYIERVKDSKLYKISIKCNSMHVKTLLLSFSSFLECKQFVYDYMHNMEDNRITSGGK